MHKRRQKNSTKVLGVALLLAGSPAMAGWWTPSNPASGDAELQQMTVTWSAGTQNYSMQRSYRLYLPSGVDQNAALPLVIVLHGGGTSYSNPYDSTQASSYWVVAPTDPISPHECTTNPGPKGCIFAPGTTTLQSIADNQKVIVAFPNGVVDTVGTANGNANIGGTGHVWNDCTGLFPGYGSTYSVDKVLQNIAPPNPVNDVAFIDQMINEIEANVRNGTAEIDKVGGGTANATVDDKRIYVTGMSNGANMALRLARELPRIAAAAIESGGEGARPANASNWGQKSIKPTNTPTYVLPANDSNSSPSVSYLPLTASDNNYCATPGYIAPLFMIKGNADIFIAYGGGTSNSSSSTWYLPYNPILNNPGTGPDLNAFPNGGYLPWPRGWSTYKDPWAFTFSQNANGIYGYSASACTTSNNVTTCQDQNAPTNPQNLTTLGNILARYGLGGTAPTAYTLQTYNPYVETSGVQSDIVSATFGSGFCDQYGSGRAMLVSCIATNNGHVQPSRVIPWADNGYSGEATYGQQNHDMETAVEEWYFFKNIRHP
jgi:poly(3-hydroxybutyrate) depolymerase